MILRFSPWFALFLGFAGLELFQTILGIFLVFNGFETSVLSGKVSDHCKTYLLFVFFKFFDQFMELKDLVLDCFSDFGFHFKVL